MNEIFQLIKKSKTAKSGVFTIVWGIMLIFGLAEGQPPKETIDGLNQQQNQTSTRETVIGVGALVSGLTALKGREDVEKKIEMEKAVREALAKPPE